MSVMNSPFESLFGSILSPMLVLQLNNSKNVLVLSPFLPLASLSSSLLSYFLSFFLFLDSLWEALTHLIV